MANLHGDVVTTVPIAATAASGDAARGVEGWSDYTEYGAPRAGSTTSTTGGTVGYGWLGSKQRSTTADTAGLTLMGDRLYNAITGRFTSLDPEPGGNATAYSYPNDPINMYDLDGHWGFKKFLRKAGGLAWKYKWDIALTAATFIPGVNAVTWGVRGAVYGLRVARYASFALRTDRAVLGASRLGNWACKARGIGARSRLFGDTYSGAGRSGLLNRGKRYALGWSGN